MKKISIITTKSFQILIVFFSLLNSLTYAIDANDEHVQAKEQTSDKTTSDIHKYREEDTIANSGLVYEKKSKQPITGFVQSYYENGELRFESSFKNGKFDGVNKVYREDGTLERDYSYNNGILNKSCNYYPSGELESVTNFINSETENGYFEYFEYYKNGNIKLEQYYKGGKLNGIAKSYREDGTLEFEANFKKGKLEGVSKSYSEDGTLKLEGTYRNGIENGISRWYYPSGKLESENYYINGKFDGVVHAYYENGKLRYEARYKNGKLEGKSYDYREDGSLHSEVGYRNDKKEGTYLSYLDSGRVCFSIVYRSGVPLHGKNSKGKKLTSAELINFDNGLFVHCQ